MRSINWCHFQWPWTNPNPVFKVMPFLDAKYITNGYRYGHNYYRRRIGNRTQAFEWHQFQWHWVTSKSDFKVMVLLLVSVHLTRDLFAIAKFLYIFISMLTHLMLLSSASITFINRRRPTIKAVWWRWRWWRRWQLWRWRCWTWL